MWRNTLKALTFIILFLNPIVSGLINPTVNDVAALTGSGEATIIHVEPQNITRKVEEVFNINVKVEDVINLYSLSINFSWDPLVLDYQNHQVKIPVENYPEGVLHEPVDIEDTVEATGGRYAIYSFSSDPAPAFNGTGVIFEMTFKVRKDLWVLEDWSIEHSSCLLKVDSSALADKEGNPIQHEVQHGRFKVLYAVLRVHPQSVSGSVGENTNISVVIENLYDGIITGYLGNQYPLGNFYGFDIKLSWVPTILGYVNHEVTIPVEAHSDPIPPSPYPGILHEPFLKVADTVNAAAGTYHIAGSSYLPATAFNGNGTVFTITFKVLKRGASHIRFEEVELSDDGRMGAAKKIVHQREDGLFSSPGAPVADFTIWPETPVVNKPVIFNASASYSPLDPPINITKYIWDFGDGTKENTTDTIIEHSYGSFGLKAVELIVLDESGIFSAPKTRVINVVHKRDIEIYSVTVSPEKRVQVGREVTINVTTLNGGEAVENFTVTTYYNQTTTWIEIEKQDVTNLGLERFKLLTFKWDTTGVTPEAYYALRVFASEVPHEENVTNNEYETTEPFLFATAEAIHDVATTSVQIVIIGLAAETFQPPVIRGENATISVDVESTGTVDETFNMTLYYLALGGEASPLEEWKNTFLVAYEKVTLTYQWNTTDMDLGTYTIVANATILEPEETFVNNVLEKNVEIISVPIFGITYSPKPVYLGDTVVLNGSASSGDIAEYDWAIFDPLGLPVASLEDEVTSYTFDRTGRWRVTLTVTDSYGITHSLWRGSTQAYLKEAFIGVRERPFPLQTIILVAIALSGVIAVLVYFLRIRKRAS